MAVPSGWGRPSHAERRHRPAGSLQWELPYQKKRRGRLKQILLNVRFASEAEMAKSNVECLLYLLNADIASRVYEDTR